MTRGRTFLDTCIDRRFLAMNALLAASVLLALFFPVSGTAERFVLAFSVYFLLPALFVRFILHERLFAFGCSWGKFGIFSNIVFVSLGACVFGLFAWGVLTGTSAGQEFLNASWASHTALHRDFLVFLGSMGFLAWFVLLKEIFFRGFFLLFWKRFVHRWSLAAHFLVVVAVSAQELHIFSHFSNNVTFLFTLTWSVLASFLAFITESVFVSFCFSLFSAILISVLAISLS